MKYLDEFRDPDLARKLLDQISELATRKWVMMEVCFYWRIKFQNSQKMEP